MTRSRQKKRKDSRRSPEPRKPAFSASMVKKHASIPCTFSMLLAHAHPCLPTYKSPCMPHPSRPPPLQIQSCLSQLGKTADGLRPAYLRVQIVGTDMKTTEELVSHKDLQVLVLQNNELTTLQHLTQLPNLTNIDVSGNKLTDVSVFSAHACSAGSREARLDVCVCQCGCSCAWVSGW